MPYLKINTNKDLDKPSAAELTTAASKLVAEILGKPESYVMIEVNAGLSMSFAGSDAALAFMELKSLGLPESNTAALSASLCDFGKQHLGINGDRIYIEFSNGERHLWGWNGATF